MSKVFQAAASDALASADFVFGSNQTEVWISFRFAFRTDALTLWEASGSCALASLKGVGGGNNNAISFGPGAPQWALTTGDVADAAVAAGTWYAGELHWKNDGTLEFYIDTALVVAGSTATTADGVAVHLGQTFGGADTFDAAAVAYIDDVAVGTTRGGTDLFADDFESGDFSAWTSEDGPPYTTIIDDPFVAFTRHEVVVKLYDLGTTELADISAIAFNPTLKRRHNQTRGFVLSGMPAGHALLTTVAGDGYANLRKGNRKLLVWEDGQIIFHGRIFTVERTGDGTQNTVTVTAWDPRMEFGYDSDDRAGRPVRDNTGNFIDPDFSYLDDGGISGPALIQDILTNSQNTYPLLGEGPLPIDIATGTFDTDVPPAIDLTPSDSMDWPILIGDFITQLTDTGVVDVDVRPVDPDEGYDPYVMGVLSAVSAQGTDRSATVHFDYWTGSFNAKECRHVEEFSTVNNKLFDYLGPRIDKEHWRANIAPDSAGVTPDVDPSRALYGGPPGATDVGQFMSIRVYDSVGDESSSRPLYLALYNAELGDRIEPRSKLYITPNPDRKALYEPPADYDVGDLIAVNVGADFGIALAVIQRVYGYDKTWDREGIARVSQLIVSADEE